MISFQLFSCKILKDDVIILFVLPIFSTGGLKVGKSEPSFGLKIDQRLGSLF